MSFVIFKLLGSSSKNPTVPMIEQYFNFNSIIPSYVVLKSFYFASFSVTNHQPRGGSESIPPYPLVHHLTFISLVGLIFSIHLILLARYFRIFLFVLGFMSRVQTSYNNIKQEL